MALAAERADDRTRACIEQAWAQRNAVQAEIVRRLIDDVGAVDLARQALQQHKDRALAALRPLRNRELKVLLHRLAGAMTKRAEEKPAPGNIA
jgi:geranylgeranyl pyrophosphate synthase